MGRIGSSKPRYRFAGSSVRGGRLSATSGVINGVTYTAVTPGTSGRGITVTIVAGGPVLRALSVAVAGQAITVAPATDAAGVITTTQAGVAAAVNGYAPASALVTASGGAATAAAATAATALAGGSDYVFGIGR